MLQISNLTVTLRKDLRTLVDNFTFTLNRGDRAVIIGEEGNGKSTLLKLIYDASLVDDYCEFSGAVSARGLRLGYLPQEFFARDLDMSAEQFSVPDGAQRKDVAVTARKLGLAAELPYETRKIATFSGGERVKLALLRVLLSEPDVLLLDEPTNDVDLTTLEFLEMFINNCEQPVLYVSHDETLIERTANVIIHLEQVRHKTVPRATVARIPYAEYIERRERSFAQQTQQARAEKVEYDAKMRKYRQIEQRVEHEQNALTRQDPHSGRLLKKKMHAVKSLGRRFERESEDMTQLPDVEEQIFLPLGSVKIPNGKTVLELELPLLTVKDGILARDIKFRIAGPEKVCITGRNGAGKTTLLRLIADELLARTDITCGYMPQNYAELLPYYDTPVKYLAPSGKKTDITRAMTALGSVKFTADEMAHTIAELSGGQKAKLLFVKMTLDGCDVLVLDEPTRNFSPLSNPVIRAMLRGFGGAVIAVSHDRKLIGDCTRVLELTETGLRPL